ncbi:efflux RND transporter periplasmic adaptor subunit [Billgrantia sulfidoxydans]|nr:efflux RND transporter periplasmic adaptor subunit [Halomonas sulfidoxydans]
MNPMGRYFFVILLGVILGVTGSMVLGGNTFILNAVETAIGNDSSETGVEERGERAPLYWVAPMDPNYKRDKPGKSPMGMDLVPVYDDQDEGDTPGTVKISPDVVNNLGVKTGTVEKDTFDTTVRTVGYVQYDEDKLVHIHPRVEGWIEKLFAKSEGDRVTQGQPLYSIYSPTLVNAQEELLLAMNRGNQRLISAALERLRALQVPTEAIQSLKDTRQVSQTIILRAPQSGVLDNLQVREGMFVSPGMSMMSIGVLDHVWAVGEVFERQAALIAEGDEVRMTLDYLPEREWTGVVDYIYPSIDSETRTARVRVRFANDDLALKPGMFSQLTIMSDTTTEALQIPREALIRTGSQSRVVLALGDGKFKSIEVDVGRVGWETVEILSGLEEGDRIVTSAQFLLDSESSRTSDFRRMEHSDSAEEADENSLVETVWVPARIEDVMPDHGMVTLSHAPIAAWNWPAMSMDFQVADTVSLEQLKDGMDIHAELERIAEDKFALRGVHVDDVKTKAPSDEGMDHGETSNAERGQQDVMSHQGHATGESK